jgi:hypothetical protein
MASRSNDEGNDTRLQDHAHLESGAEHLPAVCVLEHDACADVKDHSQSTQGDWTVEEESQALGKLDWNLIPL